MYSESSKLFSVGFHRYITSLDVNTLSVLEQEVKEFDPSSEVSRLPSSDKKTLLEYLQLSLVVNRKLYRFEH